MTEWIIEWFCDNTTMTKNEILKMESDNYVEKGVIDSFQFLGLIADIENFYEISFTEEDLMDENIFTMKGLAEIISRIVG